MNSLEDNMGYAYVVLAVIYFASLAWRVYAPKRNKRRFYIPYIYIEDVLRLADDLETAKLSGKSVHTARHLLWKKISESVDDDLDGNFKFDSATDILRPFVEEV